VEFLVVKGVLFLWRCAAFFDNTTRVARRKRAASGFASDAPPQIMSCGRDKHLVI